jgi:hypothetical protein
MSELDVLAMASGVFVLLLVMLMRYYRQTMDAHAEAWQRFNASMRPRPGLSGEHRSWPGG